jgi:type VI secretion system protein VasD
MRGCVGVVLLACGIALAGGCGSSTPPLLQGSIKADPTTNPDLHGRPSPIVVRVYELKSLGAFDTADFFSLFDKESETLGSELVGREEYDLRPAEIRPYKRQLQPDTKFIGVVAAFRDLENSRWRQSAPVPAKRDVTLTVGIEARAVTVAVK